jgi:hypothetical protein
MSDQRLVVLQLSSIEIAQLSALLRQFSELVDEHRTTLDPALARLVPAAYPDDPAASEEFGRLTRDDLLGRRADDAGTVLRSLTGTGLGDDPAALDETDAALPRVLALDEDDAAAWMRTLTAIRLVLATRLGIATETDGDPDDPRTYLYEWLGGLLEGVVQAVSRAE